MGREADTCPLRCHVPRYARVGLFHSLILPACPQSSDFTTSVVFKGKRPLNLNMEKGQ